MPIEIAGVDTKYKGWTRLVLASVRLAGGDIIWREIEDHGTAACVLPYDAERRTAVLVRQFRAPVFSPPGRR
jgi:hypothetical protein